MTIDDKDMINSILESVSRIDYIKPEDIPNIDLYMDQVTSFVDEHLKKTKRSPESSSFLPNVTQMIRFSPRL